MPSLAPAPARFHHQVTRHIERTIGPSPMVFHEIISADMHLDIHIIPPQPGPAAPDHPRGRNFFTLVTSGMSARPMPGHADSARAPRLLELMISLPADWPGLRPDGTFIQDQMCHEENWWPIRWLKKLARMPVEEDAALAEGYMVPGTPDASPYAAGTRLGCVALFPSVLHPKAAHLVVHDDIAIDFLALWPLFPEEMMLRHQHGPAALQSALTAAGITDLIDPRRNSLARASGG